MPINVPIRPNAALNDPETRQYVETEVINRVSSSNRNANILDWAFNPDGIVNILSQYPWREYTYKHGQWARVRIHDPGIPIRWWEKTYHTLMLTDAGTGQEIAEIQGLAFQAKIESPRGHALFAGDPHYAGVINMMVNDKRRMGIVGSVRLSDERHVDPLSFGDGYRDVLKKASELATIMVPERRPEVRSYETPAQYLRRIGPWLADHPNKPPRGRWR